MWGGRGTGRCMQGCWDADVFSWGLSSSPSPPSSSRPPHLTLGAPRNRECRQRWRVTGRQELGSFVCLSLGDCIRRCSSITDGAVVSVQ